MTKRQDLNSICEELIQKAKFSTRFGAVARPSDRKKLVEVISTRSLAIDGALNIGGLPRGRIVEVFGHEAVGKTTLALQVIAEVHRAGGHGAFFDADHALDLRYAEKLGVDVERLLVFRPDAGEHSLEAVRLLSDSRFFDVIVIDSLTALPPKATLEGQIGDKHGYLHSKMMSEALSVLTPSAWRSNSLLLFTNQFRTNPDVLFQRREVTTGGVALRHYSSVRLEMRRMTAVKDGESVIGDRIKIQVAKHRLGARYQEGEIDLLFGHGISREGELLDLGIKHFLLKMGFSSHGYLFNDHVIPWNRESARQLLIDLPELSDQLEAKVREALGLRPKALAKCASA